MLLVADAQPLHGDADLVSMISRAASQFQYRLAVTIMSDTDHAECDTSRKARTQRFDSGFLGSKPLGQQPDL